MKHEQVLEAIQPIFHEIFEDESLIITNETNADDIEEWDSLAQINLVVEMEKKFAVKFYLEDLQDLKNVGDMVRLILLKMSQRKNTDLKN